MAFTLSIDVSTVYTLENGGPYDAENGTALMVEGAAVVTDLTSYVRLSSVTLKFNTLDFVLENPPAGSYELGAAVTTTDPSWVGTIAITLSAEAPGDATQQIVTVTATNATALPTDTAPFDLSDSPIDSTFRLLLEDGSSFLLLESGTDFSSPNGKLLLEGDLSYPYAYLTIREQVDVNSTHTTIGTATVHSAGLRPGNVVRVTSAKQGLSATKFRISQATVTWPEVITQPDYAIELGDVPQTLAEWTQVSAPAGIVPVSAPVVVPSGPVIYGKCSAGHVIWPQGGGIVTVASASFTVSAGPGHSLTVQLVGQIDCRAWAWDNYIATPRRAVRATISGAIFTGAWQETPAGTATTAGARGIYDLSSAPGIALADGTYTVSLQIDTQEFNTLEVFSAYAQAVVTTV